MSVVKQYGVDSLPCTVCGLPIAKDDGWSFRHREKEPFALLTCCGKCKNLLIEVIRYELA